MVELKRDVSDLTHDVTKLRMELANMRTRMTQDGLAMNGFSAGNGASLQRSRFTLDV